MISLSFVIPCYNEEALIGRCIRSIRKEAPAAEIIVVDNNSTDNTVLEALKALEIPCLPAALAEQGVRGLKYFDSRWAPFRIVGETQQGITRARQAGLEAATTDWVAFIDADTTLPEDWIIECLHQIMRPGVVAVSGPPTYPELMRWANILVFVFYCVGALCHRFIPILQGGNFVVNREALVKAGGFDTDISFYGEDTATAIRLSTQGKIIFSLGLYSKTSARRFKAEGLVFTGIRYATNYFWMWILGRPFTRTHSDHREAT